MKLLETYNFGDAEFNPGTTISIHSVIDNYSEKKCIVNLSLQSDTVKAVRTIGEFSYANTWDDNDVWIFIKTKIDVQ